MSASKEKSILACWQKNARPWTKAVRQQEIESRRLVTDLAIVDVILAVEPASVIDVGCGEGWLARELLAKNIDVLGVDAEPELINNAQQIGSGRFDVVSYADIAAGELREQFDVAVCNFSLLGKESVESLFKAMPLLLNDTGYFVVQTLHPMSSCGQQDYKDGWREGSWQGFNNDFTAPAPWYFRTLESWLQLFQKSGFAKPEIIEPVHPETGQKCAIIFITRLAL